MGSDGPKVCANSSPGLCNHTYIFFSFEILNYRYSFTIMYFSIIKIYDLNKI